MNQNYGAMNGNFWSRMKDFFFQKSALPRLILINVIVFLAVAIVNMIGWLFKLPEANFLVRYLAVPSYLPTLAVKPWTVFTYMFLHEGFWHLFFNMVMLFFAGKIFLQFLSEKQLIWTYIIGGLMGAAFYILAYNIFPVFEATKLNSIALGASASVLAILVAIAVYQPNLPIRLFLFGQMSFKWVAIIFVAIDFFSISSGNPGGHIAHLGGALWGFLYGYLLRKGTDLVSFNISFPKRKFRVHKNKQTNMRSDSGRPLSDEEYNQRKANEQAEIDAILDKISQKGYSSLSDKEKNFLFRSSKKQ